MTKCHGYYISKFGKKILVQILSLVTIALYIDELLANERDSSIERDSAYPAVMLTIPMQMKRCGFAMRLLIQGPNQARQQLREARLINLIAKAYDWLERLTSG